MTSRRHSNESQKRGTATEHAKQPQDTAIMEEARADRADDSLEHLALKLADFLASCYDGLQTYCDDIEEMVFEKISEWAKTPRENASYGYPELLLHKKIWDVLNRDKQGVPKEHSFVDWCRRIALHRTESTAANSAATEHDDRFKKLVKDIFANDLTPEQKKDRKYQLREGAHTRAEDAATEHVLEIRCRDEEDAGSLASADDEDYYGTLT